MRELIDLVSVYLAMAFGLGVAWWGTFKGWGAEETIVRALVCVFAALVLGALSKGIWYAFVLFAGRGKRVPAQGGREGGEETGG